MGIFESLDKRKYKRRIVDICDKNKVSNGSLKAYFLSFYYPNGVDEKEKRTIEIVLKRIYFDDKLDIALKCLEDIRKIKV